MIVCLEGLLHLGAVREGGQRAGDGDFRAMQQRGVHRVVFDGDQPSRLQLLQRVFESLGRNVELLEPVVELGPRREDVTLVDRLADEVQYAALHAPQVIACDTERLGDPIGRAKADAADLFRDDIRIVPDDSRSIRAVLADDFARGRGAHSEGVQKAHRFCLDAPLANGLGDRFCPPLADAGHLAQPRRLCGDDIEGLRAEALDEPRGQGRADAWDQPGAEVADHALLRGRNGRCEGDDTEARPIDRVLGPPAHQSNILPGSDLAEVANRGVGGG